MKRLYYIKGNWFSRRNFIKQIKKQIKDYNLYVFDDEHSFKYILNIIKELDCFNEFKLIIINDWPKFKNKSKSQIRNLFIKNIIGKIPNNCCVIFNNLETKSKKFIDVVKQNGEFHFFKNELNRNEIIKLIKNFFANREKKIQDDIICFLVDSITVMNSTIKTEKLILLL
ncbi:hypothetical protein K9M42_03015, partial [Patescibacteria group bacterium]|nr:hypothetical protein [Patescibacteria group bacterium]